MAAVRALLFDFNGTLSDDEPLLCSIYRDLFAEHGRPLSEEKYYAQLAGLSEEAIIGGWLGVDGTELEALVRERIARFTSAAGDGSTIAETTREAVRYAAGRARLAVVSGAFRAEIAPALEAAGLAGLFATVVAADDVENGKPAPDGYLEALRRLGDLPAAEAVAFEDTEVGVASAKAAGLRCLARRGTVAPERLRLADGLVDAIDVDVVRALVG